MRSVIIIAFCLLAGCATQPPASTPDVDKKLSGASLTYVLPVTEVTVAQDLTITGCTDGKASFKSTYTVAVTAVEGVESHTLNGAAWTSWTKSRDVTVALYDTKAIKTINATSSDRSLAAAASIIKTVTAFAGAFTANDSGLSCSPDSQAAWSAVERLDSEVRQQRALLSTAKPAAIPGIIKTIDALAAQAATLKTSKLLTVSLPAQTLDLTHLAGAVVWAPKAFNSVLVDGGSKDYANALTLSYCLETDETIGKCDAARIQADTAKLAPNHEIKAGAITPTALASGPCPGDDACARTIVLRSPKVVTAIFVPTGQGYGARTGEVAKALKLPMAQWGTPTYLSLDVGLAQSRTVGLSLDELGRRTSLAWKSDARLESIATGGQGVVEAAAAYKKAADGQEAADRNAASTELESKQKYNKLKACEEVINSGGFKCPES